jgi:hypothetical protein
MFVDTKPEMSDRQFATARAVVERDGESAVRFRDCSVSTLIAMARPARAWATLVWDHDGSKRYISHAELTEKGRKVFAREQARRAAVADQQRKLDKILNRPAAITGQGPIAEPAAAARVRSIIDQADPFTVLATGHGRTRPAVHPDSPYGDDIPF